MTPYTFAGMILPEWFQHIKYRTPTITLAEEFVVNHAGNKLIAALACDSGFNTLEYVERTGLHLFRDADTLQHDRDAALLRTLSEIE